MQTGKLKWNFHRNLNPFFEFNYNNNSNKKGNKKQKSKSDLQPLGGANAAIFSAAPTSENNAPPWPESVWEWKHVNSDKASWKILYSCKCCWCFTLKNVSAANEEPHRVSPFRRWSEQAPPGCSCQQLTRRNPDPRHPVGHRWPNIFLKQSKKWLYLSSSYRLTPD